MLVGYTVYDRDNTRDVTQGENVSKLRNSLVGQRRNPSQTQQQTRKRAHFVTSEGEGGRMGLQLVHHGNFYHAKKKRGEKEKDGGRWGRGGICGLTLWEGKRECEGGKVGGEVHPQALR